MKSNVIQFGPSATADDQVEPVESAVSEVSGDPAVRRACPRTHDAVEPSRPVTFFSIEEAAPSTESAPLQVA